MDIETTLKTSHPAFAILLLPLVTKRNLSLGGTLQSVPTMSFSAPSALIQLGTLPLRYAHQARFPHLTAIENIFLFTRNPLH